MRSLLPALFVVASCGKVPIHDVAARFDLADATWFEEEQTLFVFWDVTADQGIGEPSVVEITWETDDGEVDWVSLDALTNVHTHLPVDCGEKSLCGSASVHIPLEPRDVRIRLRYHRDGALALNAETVFNVIGSGDPWANRSLVVYGVFDQDNEHIQWRGRHQFPTIRNHQAEDLGLRRTFSVDRPTYGTYDTAFEQSPYGYGISCPGFFTPTELSAVSTDERAIFVPERLPDASFDASQACARATVTDALGTFTTGAHARKNPEVRDAFPSMRSPVHDARTLPFFLAPCTREIDAVHEEMQRQRLQIGDLQPTCTETWREEDYADNLAALFVSAIEEARQEGDDMVLVVGVHRDEAGVADKVEEALAQVLPNERTKSTPRVAGAFVFDSASRVIDDESLDRNVLWCPSTLLASGASSACAVLPIQQQLNLGPLSFTQLPILPPRDRYLSFVDDYSVNQAGSVETLTFRVPEFAADGDHLELPGYGVATFEPGTLITASPEQEFSYCVPENPDPVVFRTPFLQDPDILGYLYEQCEFGVLDEEMCSYLGAGIMPIEYLGTWHAAVPEGQYELGLAWDFPFLLQIDYRSVIAGSATALGVSVPFGIGNPATDIYGGYIWQQDRFELDSLLQCTRFCDHPTFDPVGSYQVNRDFSVFRRGCYLPTFPRLTDGGFPFDP